MKNLTQLFLFCFISICRLAAAAEPRTPGETVAIRYMEAFFHGDIETVAGFLGSAVLDPFKKMTLEHLEGATNPERLQFLAAVGYSSMDDFRAAAARDIFIRLTKVQRNESPDLVEKAKAATVAIEKVEKLDAEKQRITLKIHIPDSPTQTASVVVQMVEDRWLIVGI